MLQKTKKIKEEEPYLLLLLFIVVYFSYMYILYV